MKPKRQGIGQNALPQRTLRDVLGIEHVESGGFAPDIEVRTYQPAVSLCLTAGHEHVLLGDLISRVRPAIDRALFGIDAGNSPERPAVFRTAATESEGLPVALSRTAWIYAGKLGGAWHR